MPDGFRIASAFVEVKPDLSGFSGELKEKLDEAVAGMSAKARVSLDTSDLDAKVDLAKAKVDELDGARAEPSVRLNSEGLSASADEAHAKLDELDSRSARPDIGLDANNLDAHIEEARAKIEELDSKTADPRLNLETAEFDAKVIEAKAKLAELNTDSASPRVDASGYLRDSRGRFAGGGAGGEGGGAGGGGGRRSGGGGGEGGGLGGLIAMGVGGLMPAVAGAGAGLGLLGAAGGLAFGGVANALSASRQASRSTGLLPQQLAATNFSNQVAVQAAQEQVGNAQQQAAQDAITSAQSIAQARMGLASAERNAAEQQIQALQSVKQAEQGVEEANYGLSEAQYNLNQAWVSARQNIMQLNDQLADSKLSTDAAKLAVQQAEYQQRLVDQNAYSTALDRQQAALAVAQAQQQVKDATDQQTIAQQKANQANKEGVAGSQQVIQAKQALTQAQFGQQNAQAQYADAQRQLTLTELNNQQQIKQAQMSVAAAQEQAAYQQMRDAQSVADAQRNVTNTIKEQQLQMAATKATSNQAANQFAQDMAKLTPAGRNFVNQILGMKGAFKQLEDAAQNATLPGFTALLQGVQKILPTVQGGISQMGSALGQMASQVGKALATPAAAQVIAGLIQNGVQFAKIVLPAFGQFAAKLAEIGSKKGAVDGLANLLAGFARGLTGMADAIGKNEGPINAFLTAAGNVIAKIGPPLGQMVGLVAKALAPLTGYLNAHPNGTVAKVIGDIVAGLLAVQGLKRVLPDFITKPLEDLAGKGTSKVGDLLAAPFKAAGSKIASTVKGWGPSLASAIKGAMPTKFDVKLLAQYAKNAGSQVASSMASGLSRVGGFFTETLPQATRAAGQALSSFASSSVTVISGWGSKVGQAATSAASSIASFAATMGSKLAQAAVAVGTWIAENTVAIASYIAENVAAAASAMAAFVAENLATLGLIAGIGLVIAAIVLLATHWKDVWHGIEVAALWLWHNVLDPMWQGIVAGAKWLYEVGIKPYFDMIKVAFGALETAAMWLWHNVFDPLWQGIEAGARGFISAFQTAWNGLESIFKTPVNFLIDVVYTKGIEALWNEVVGAVGAGSLKLPNIPHLAAGGVLPGYAPGQDTVPTMLSPGEGVLVPEAVQAIGPGTVHALNAQFGKGRVSTGGHFSGGGIIGTIGNVIGSVVSGGSDIVKIASAVLTGNTTALSNALDKLVGTNAVGNFGKLMLDVPTKLISTVVNALMSFFGGGSSGGGGGGGGVLPSGQHLAIIDQALAAAGVPPPGTKGQWEAGLNTLIGRESGWNPRAINLTDSNAAMGDPSRGLAQTIMSTFLAHHVPGTSMDIYDPVANVAAAIRYIVADYGNITNVQQADANKPPKGYDQGGVATGIGMLPKYTPLPERVLNPHQTERFDRLVELLERMNMSGGTTGSASGQAVNFNYYGPQEPTLEMKAQMRRDLAMALGG